MADESDLSDDTVDRVLSGSLRPEDRDAGLAPVSGLLRQVRGAFRSPSAPAAGTDLARLFAPLEPAPSRRRRAAGMVAAFVGTLAGKAVVGTAVAAAAVGGVHGAGVDLPLVSEPDHPVVNVSESHRLDADPGQPAGSETGEPVGARPQPAGGSADGGVAPTAGADPEAVPSTTVAADASALGQQASADATGASDGSPGVDGHEVSDDARAQGDTARSADHGRPQGDGEPAPEKEGRP